ncbi:MAG: penicillin acylase family protein [Ferruginibacter sp.]
MRIFFLILSLIITIALCVILDSRLILPAPLGKLLSPQHGIWQNAEPADYNFSGNKIFSGLKGKVDVYFDDRLVPHIFAEDENDAFFVQGYIHAKFRLWQMELQSMAAAGRASEFAGEVALEHDREFRRLGMVYAAENSLKEMENDPIVKAASDAYTAGVNSYIENCKESELPLEYKLVGYHPEKWTNLKSALFLKYMSHNLASQENDFELTQAKNFFSAESFRKLFPYTQDSLDPIISKGTIFPSPGVVLKAPVDYDTITNIPSVPVDSYSKADKDNGSNNWAVSGSKTSSGSPIICNDPHLGLNLPSLWYEIQISTPTYNAYGVSFPGAPSVIIGYNDSCAWGFTNGGRDVRDYYEIKFKDDSRNEYWFDSSWRKTEFRYEVIKIKGSPDFIDTVAYTLFGPVMYDKNFGEKKNTNKKNYAVRWKAHDPSKELLVFLKINHAKNYSDYLAAVEHMRTPGQNFVFASRNGDIALRTQGEWPAKWKGQGDYIMPGTDSSYLWQGMIPQGEVPFQYNPERGYVSSANQRPVDTLYPYYLGRVYPVARGFLINRMLTSMQQITPQDMQKMQTDNYNVFAEWALPLFLKNIRVSELNPDLKRYYGYLKTWDLRNDIQSKAATIFEISWKNLYDLIYKDEYATAPDNIAYPLNSSLLEGLLKDSAYQFLDNIQTQGKEDITDIITSAFKNSFADLKAAELNNKMEWGKYKDTRIKHILKLEPLSRMHLPVGGGANMINATKEEHGPSWRMIVSLTKDIEAFGVYPGGQSGNPGSRFYDNFIDPWVAGKYYTLWMMKKEETDDARVKWKMEFNRN